MAPTTKPKKQRKNAGYSPAPALLSLLPHHVNRQALLTPVLAAAFAELHVNASLYVKWWYPIHTTPSVSVFEYDLGVASRRWAYNQRCFEEAQRTQRAVIASHVGFNDLFVPILHDNALPGFLVV